MAEVEAGAAVEGESGVRYAEEPFTGADEEQHGAELQRVSELAKRLQHRLIQL